MPTITDVPQMLRDFDFALAQLRHAYKHLADERVKLQRELAVGLISPQIKKLENIRTQIAEELVPGEYVQWRGRIK